MITIDEARALLEECEAKAAEIRNLNLSKYAKEHQEFFDMVSEIIRFKASNGSSVAYIDNGEFINKKVDMLYVKEYLLSRGYNVTTSTSGGLTIRW